MKATRVVCVGALAMIEFVQAVEPPIDVEQVAKAFDVPVSDVRRTLKTDEVISKFGDSVQSASLFEFEAAPNAFMQVVVAKGRFLMTDALRGKLEAEPGLIEKVDLKNGGIAFVGTEGTGPGAEGYVAIGHLSSQNVDFRLRVLISNDGATASSGASSGTFRSSTLLKNALRKLAISSSATLSKELRSSPLMDQGRQSVDPPGFPSRNVLRPEDDSRELGRERLPSEAKSKALGLFGFLLGGFFVILLIVFHWLKRMNTRHKEEGRIE